MAHHAELLLPCLDAVGARSVVEVGAFAGDLTRVLVDWAERQGCTPDVIERLQILLRQAPEAAAAWMRPTGSGTPEATFDHHYILIMGRKPAG